MLVFPKLPVDRGLGWVFCTPQGFCLQQHLSTQIHRHVKVRSHQSPFDGDWRYWATRRGHYPGTSPTLAKLLNQQAGKCPHCGLFFGWESGIEIHHCNGNWHDNRFTNLQALHRHCHDQVHGAAPPIDSRTNDKDLPVEEPCEVKVSSTVLKPSGGGDSFA